MLVKKFDDVRFKRRLALNYLILAQNTHCDLLKLIAECDSLVSDLSNTLHAEKAVSIYTELLKQHSEDVSLKWLLTIAYHLTDETIPINKSLLISDKVFASDIDFKPFNVAVVSIWMGLLKTERTQQVFDAQPELYAHLEATAETPQFTGRVIDALARDTNRMERSGKIWVGAELGE